MKRRGQHLLLLTMILGLLGSQVSQAADNEKPTASADIAFLTQYVWRGLAFSDDSLVIQPSAKVQYHGVSINLWSHVDTDLYNATSDQGNLQQTETDLTLAYDKNFGSLTTGVGYIYYGLDSFADSQEVYISLGMDMFLSPSFTVYREMAYYPGWYFNVGISHSFNLTDDGISLDIAGSLSYLDVDGASGFLNDGLISLGITLPIYDYFSLSPIIAYAVHLSENGYDALKAGSADGEANHLYGGATLSMAF